MPTPQETEEFVVRHWDLAHRIIFARSRGVPHAALDDVRSDGLLALWEAAESYDPSKGPEIPHVLRVLNYRIIDFYRERVPESRRRFKVTVGSFGDFHENTYADPSEAESEMLNLIALNTVMEALEVKHRRLLASYFLEGRMLKEIAVDEGVTESMMSRRLKEAVTKARKIANNPPRRKTNG